jgi:hypothetical protein
MNFSYSGLPIVHRTLTQVAGTRQEIIDFLNASLQAAGWTAVSGGAPGSATPILNSAVCPHFPNFMRVNLSAVQDPTNAVVQVQTWDQFLSSGWLALNPAVARTYRFIGNAYQFFIMQDTVTSTNDWLVFAGLGYLPAPLRGTMQECYWSMNAGNVASFRGGLYQQAVTYLVSAGGNRWATGSQGTFAGQLRAAIPNDAGASGYGKKWSDGSYNISDVTLIWGRTSNTSSDAPNQCLMWDAFYSTEPAGYGAIRSVDGHNWFCITNLASVGSIFLLIP